MKFEELNLIQPLVDAVHKAKYGETTPIQEKAIPAVLSGKDILATAQTGTGKTAAFALPILHKLSDHYDHNVRALIMTPTRELAVQIFEDLKKYGRYLKIRDCCVYGGAPQRPQKTALFKGCDVLVATPGRLNDFMNQGVLDLSHVEMFVLDEADRMLDMGFLPDVRKIVNDLPEERQTLMFSATMPREIETLADELLNDPEEIHMAPQSTPAETVDQHLIYVNKPDKKRVLPELLKEENVRKAIVFTRTKVRADRLVKKLAEAGIEALAIHGDKTQGQRMNALQRFRTNQIHVLVATDVAARGIDIPDVTHVFNYDMPEEPESYIHRIGRAGRAGKEGTSVSLCCEEEIGLLAAIERLIGKKIPVMTTEWSLDPAAMKRSHGHRLAERTPEGRKKSSGYRSKRSVKGKKPFIKSDETKSSRKESHKKPARHRYDAAPSKETKPSFRTKRKPGAGRKKINGSAAVGKSGGKRRNTKTGQKRRTKRS